MSKVEDYKQDYIGLISDFLILKSKVNYLLIEHEKLLDLLNEHEKLLERIALLEDNCS
jgi:hypothetical protein